MADIKIDEGVLREACRRCLGEITQPEYPFGSGYRWRAIKCFREHWKIDDSNFRAMVYASLGAAHGTGGDCWYPSQSINIGYVPLAGPRELSARPCGYFLMGVIRAFTEKLPKEMYSEFCELFDESADLKKRFKKFEEWLLSQKSKVSDIDWIKRGGLTPNNVQGIVSMCLWLCYPDKYYIYENDVVETAARNLRVDGVPSDMYDRMFFGRDLYHAIRKKLELSEYSDLVKMLKERVEKIYGDNHDSYNQIKEETFLNMLAIDIGYVIGDTNFSLQAIASPTSVQTTGEIIIDEPPLDNDTQDKNIILYGPPGTGKTYSTVLYAVSIIEGKELDNVKNEKYKDVFKRYQEYKGDGKIVFTTFHQSFGYEEFIEGIRPVAGNNGGGKDIEYKIQDGVFKAFCEKATSSRKPRVFIIDEINRGNISKVFGELITLVEPTKRIGAAEEQKARLPYSGKEFGVPKNVFIIGTMNTADRSIAMIDTALRRRFKFIEMQPDSSLFDEGFNVEGIDIKGMLDNMNRRITALLDREHTIGHSYFLPLKKDPSMKILADIFENKIMPLLQEYFYYDYEKIRYVLGDDQKNNEGVHFVVKKESNPLFGSGEDIDYSKFYYEVNREAFKKVEAYESLK